MKNVTRIISRRFCTYNSSCLLRWILQINTTSKTPMSISTFFRHTTFLHRLEYKLWVRHPLRMLHKQIRPESKGYLFLRSLYYPFFLTMTRLDKRATIKLKWQLLPLPYFLTPGNRFFLLSLVTFLLRLIFDTQYSQHKLEPPFCASHTCSVTHFSCLSFFWWTPAWSSSPSWFLGTALLCLLHKLTFCHPDRQMMTCRFRLTDFLIPGTLWLFLHRLTLHSLVLGSMADL